MKYIGDLALGQTIDYTFNTASGNTGLLIAPVGATFAVYKANSTTESVAGITFTASWDGRVGFNLLRITTATDLAFYAAGADYRVVFTAGTVDGDAMAGVEVFSFSVQNRAAYTIGNTAATNAATATDAAVDAFNAALDALNAANLAAGRLPAAAPGALNGLPLLDAAGTVGARMSAAERLAIFSAALAAANGAANGTTLQQILQGLDAIMFGKSTDGVFRNKADTRNVISATFDDDENRTAMAYDFTI